MLRRLALFLLLMAMAACVGVPADAKVAAMPGPRFHAIAWEHQGRIKLAIAYTSPERQEFWVGVGY